MTYSATQLSGYQNALIQDIQTHTNLFSGFVVAIQDDRNIIVVTINVDDPIFRTRAAAIVPAGAMTIRADTGDEMNAAASSSQFVYTEHQGGLAIDISAAPSFLEGCTIGFTMLDDTTGLAEGLTAGHCFANSPGTTQYVAVPTDTGEVAVGSLLREHNHDSSHQGVDSGLYSISDQTLAKPELYTYPNKSRLVNGEVDPFNMVKGSRVCIAGRQTRDCGKIGDTNVYIAAKNPDGWVATSPGSIEFLHGVLPSDSGSAMYRAINHRADADGTMSFGTWGPGEYEQGLPSRASYFVPISTSERAIGAHVDRSP
jgi:hypothetical protein